MSPSAIFLFKWLQQNTSSWAKSGTDRGFQTRGKRRGQMIYWKRLLLGVREKKSRDRQRAGWGGWEGLLMNLTAMGAVYEVERLDWPENSSSEDSQLLPDELLQPSDDHRAQTMGGGVRGARGSSRAEGEMYFTTMSHFMGQTSQDGLKCYCPLEEDHHNFRKHFSSLGSDAYWLFSVTCGVALWVNTPWIYMFEKLQK